MLKRSKTIRSKSRNRCWNSSRTGKAISASSFSGVLSSFSGGRRMVKWTRSTFGSAFSSRRQVRSPACGSPETRSTRSRSRTPLIVTTARLFRVETSPGRSSAATSTTVGPPRSIGTAMRCSRPSGTLSTRGAAPSRRMVRRTAPPSAAPAGTPRSSATTRSSTERPTMPKPGASITRSRRSTSPGRPASRAWKGASRAGPPAAPGGGMSWTCPSVRATMPARRARGISARAVSMAP
ncbi:hypothetical protein ROTAS13_04673 [Roseomonas sp. TAS13]|nr:hypothetical protein ROTAS13_04673 [Roseomonas sp. TAS13]